MHMKKSRMLPNWKNGFFAKVLSSILIFSLALVSLVFLLIHQNVKSHSMEQAHQVEQETVSNISYSASIMQGTALSILNQLSTDSEFLQLIYSMDTENIFTVRAMSHVENYTRASNWLDSLYICNNKESKILYSYLKGRGDNAVYSSSFCSQEDFFDREFVESLYRSKSAENHPVMRQVRYKENLPARDVFTYYLPVQSSSAHFDGFFVVNINANRLMELSYGIVSNSERQILIADTSGYISSGSNVLLDKGQQEALLRQIMKEEAAGQIVIEDADAICTWTRSRNTGLTFVSCKSYSDIKHQLSTLNRWFLFFYFSIVLFAALVTLYLSKRINSEYSALQKRYSAVREQYSENYSYIKQAILRNFFTIKRADFVADTQFSDNGIDLAEYRGYTLLLLYARHYIHSGEEEELPYRKFPAFLLEQVSMTLPHGMRFELVDMLQGYFLLVCETDSAEDWKGIFENLEKVLSEGGVFSGVYQEKIESDGMLSDAYFSLKQVIELMFFYPSCKILPLSELQQRSFSGKEKVETLRSGVVQALCSQDFPVAKQLLNDFFDEWFEPFPEALYTLEPLVAGLAEYISTFKCAYAVPLEFDSAHFRMELQRAESSAAVRALFLNLIQDLSCAFASIGSRSNYIDKLIDYMNMNYADVKLNADVLADYIGLSTSHMQNIFKNATGNSISVYLRRLRLNKAAELLTNTNIPISEIAQKTGFSNSNYFYTVFKNHYSITPTEYRASSQGSSGK